LHFSVVERLTLTCTPRLPLTFEENNST
jgi:hypothetical protein